LIKLESSIAQKNLIVLFFLTESSNTSKEHTMATTRQNQIGWQQFSHRFLGKNTRQEQDDYDDNNNRNDPFDEAVQSRQKPHQKQPRQTRKHVQFVQITTEKAPEKASAAHEEVHKAKTRAQKRAIEDAIPIEPEAAASKHKERRSDYWVHHDDIRMNRARVWKMNTQQHDN
jgi:hypothetical protein